VTAQLWAAFSVQFPVLEMSAPIQKTKYGRCRKTPKVLPMVELYALSSVSATENSYQVPKPEAILTKNRRAPEKTIMPEDLNALISWRAEVNRIDEFSEYKAVYNPVVFEKYYSNHP
jgi:hypothetical protein